MDSKPQPETASRSSALQPIIDAAVDNLNKTYTLIQALEPSVFADRSVGPYFSSVGDHIRHVLDVFQALFSGVARGEVDFTHRVRGTEVETNPALATQYLERTIDSLQNLRKLKATTPITVVDDLGLGRVSVPTTLGGGLSQAHSHAIHHYASIGYLLEHQGLQLPDRSFGYNPTTPRDSDSS